MLLLIPEYLRLEKYFYIPYICLMRKAFTIVELLVVMAVIGILISLAVVGIQAIQKAQRETTRQNDLRNFQSKIEEFYGRFRFYPRMVTAGSRIEVKGETVPGWDPGKRVCISNPTAGNFYNCTSSTTTGSDGADKPFSFLDVSSGTGIYTVTEVTVATYSTFNCNSNFSLQQDANGLVGSAPSSEQWGIFYKSNGLAPQQYTLFGCTETGKTQNFGTLD